MSAATYTLHVDEIRFESLRCLAVASSMAPLAHKAATFEAAQTLIHYLRAVPPAWPSTVTDRTLWTALLDASDTLDSIALYRAANAA